MTRSRWLVPAVVITLAAAGCSDPSSAGGDAGAGATAAASSWASPTARLDGVNLTMFTAQSTASVPNDVIAAFEKATGAKITNVTVPDQYETNVQTRLAAGDKPDLMLWQATRSGLANIRAATELQSLNGAPWLPLLNKASQDIGAVDGVHYAAPIKAPSIIGVYYNKKAFAKAGITKAPVGYAGLVEAAKALKAAGVKAPVYEASADRWPTQWCVQTQMADLAEGGFWDRANTNKDKFTNPEVVERITDCRRLYRQYGNTDIKTATFVDQAAALWSGDAGMVIQVNALVDQVSAGHSLQDINDTLGFFPISPTGSTGTAITEQTNTVVAFKSDSKREAATRQFLSFWLTDHYPDFIEKQRYVSLQPKVPSPATVADISKANVADAVPQVVGSMQNEAIVNPDLYLNLVDMYAGQKTPQQVAEVTQAQFAQIAKAQGAAGF